jgi:hypothetical protein
MAAGLPPTGDFIEQLKLLERRVKKIETKNRERVEFYNPETASLETGRIITDTDANYIHVQNDEIRGVQYPHDHTQWIVPVTQSITTATWTTIAEVELQVVNGDVIQFSAALVSSVGTTVGVRLVNGFDSSVYGTQTQAGATNGITCEWLHPFTVGWGENGANSGLDSQVLVQYQVQNTNAVGTVTAFTPRSLIIRNSRFTSNESASTPFTFI